ncbi:hypothetical protein QBC47DRAFT_114113 [Echria macrotheca]|uniref:Uncharacterized protein n=1 Tax=Echria macrotheca TaxID=438768 RepID=A0AAJ0BKM2_9PEZI|nr:hypothetical protein QBC47DRAFT_114113 [Echria macrotheca]
MSQYFWGGGGGGGLCALLIRVTLRHTHTRARIQEAGKGERRKGRGGGGYSVVVCLFFFSFGSLSSGRACSVFLRRVGNRKKEIRGVWSGEGKEEAAYIPRQQATRERVGWLVEDEEEETENRVKSPLIWMVSDAGC